MLQDGFANKADHASRLKAWLSEVKMWWVFGLFFGSFFGSRTNTWWKLNKWSKSTANLQALSFTPVRLSVSWMQTFGPWRRCYRHGPTGAIFVGSCFGPSFGSSVDPSFGSSQLSLRDVRMCSAFCSARSLRSFLTWMWFSCHMVMFAALDRIPPTLAESRFYSHEADGRCLATGGFQYVGKPQKFWEI